MSRNMVELGFQIKHSSLKGGANGGICANLFSKYFLRILSRIKFFAKSDNFIIIEIMFFFT